MELKVRSLSILLIITVLVNCLCMPLVSGKSEDLFFQETLSASQNPDLENPVTERAKAEISNFTHDHVVYLKVSPVVYQIVQLTFTFIDLTFKDLFKDDNLRPPIYSV